MDDKRQKLIDQAISDLKAKGVWDKIDSLYVFAAAKNSKAAMVNLKKPEVPMTKKDYELVARAVKSVNSALDQASLNLIVLSLCKEFKIDNPGFRPDKFIKACGADTSVLLAL